MPLSPQPPSADPIRLALIERARQTVLDTRETGVATGLSPTIERSWHRCLAMGHEPERAVVFNTVTRQASERALEANQAFLRAAAPVVRTLTRAMLHTHYFAILTDAQGTVIDVNGPVDHSHPAARAMARVGIDLSEAAVGTTAIGTTLAEQAPVWLHRGEHFFRDTSIFSCAGDPIWGPDGGCIGMLYLTGVNVH